MARSSQKNLSDCLKFRSERPFFQLSPDEYFRVFPTISFFFDAGPENCRTRWGKRVQRVRPDRPVSKNRSFI